MRIILHTWTIFIVAGKRLFSQRGLALAVTLGLIMTVALAVSLPLYADAVSFRILQEELGTAPGSQTAFRSPFAFMFLYNGGLHEPLEWADVQPVDGYLRGPAGTALGLPRKLAVRHLATDKLKLFAGKGGAYSDTKKPLGWISIGCVSDLEPHVTVLEGQFPAVAPVSSDSTVDVLASEALATRLGLQVGETYVAMDLNQTLREGASLQIPVRIAGIWKARDPEEPFWFYSPEALNELLLVPEETFGGRIGGNVHHEVYVAVWYLVMDGAGVNVDNATALLYRIRSVQQRASNLLPNISLNLSPAEALQKYQVATTMLSILLYAFSVPVIGLVLAFIGLVAGLLVERQRNEIAIFRSRGATTAQVLGIVFCEGALSGCIALAAGIPAGEWLAGLMGRTRSFLDFSAESSLRVGPTLMALRSGLILLGLALVAQVLPAVGAARHTIITYKQERARTLRPPWWQRAWLDVLLLIPAGYGLYLLRQQGSIVPMVRNVLPGDPFQNPLFVLVPALGIFALTMFILRLVPPVMAVISWLASHTGSVGVLLTARHLSRTHGPYATPLALLVVTLSLSTYTASLAQTMDGHMVDRAYYEVGADMRVSELAQSSPAGVFAPQGSLASGGSSTNSGVDSSAVQAQGREWEFLPVSEHLKVPGIQGAARVARYHAGSRLSGGQQSGVFIGVDRVDFSRVAFWRRDFAPVSLGALMNALAVAPDGVLLPRDFMGQHALNVGDSLRVTVEGPGHKADVDLKIVGSFTLFPSWYPEQGPLFVGNLDYLFERMGGQLPYDVWLKVAPDQEAERIVAGMEKVGLRVLSWDAPMLKIQRQERRPERQGVFGLLSVGFAAAALLTVLGFMLYALFSFRRRFIELGVLRAIGLSSSQMTVLLASELAFLILTGLVAGTVLGAGVSELFIPYLQIGAESSARFPPFLVTIAWPAILRIYVLLGLLFAVTLALLVALLMRMRIFQAVKLGEAV